MRLQPSSTSRRRSGRSEPEARVGVSGEGREQTAVVGETPVGEIRLATPGQVDSPGSEWNWELTPLSDREFQHLARLVREIAGIHLTDAKKALVQSRLGPRCRELGLPGFGAYLSYIRRHPDGRKEVAELINRITTNVSEFFRVPQQFEILRQTVLPQLLAAKRKRGERRLRIWSAGCASGQEPYSIAMIVAEALAGAGGWDVKILGTDIATDPLRRALEARYPVSEVEGVPERLARKYLRPASGSDGMYEVAPEVRKYVLFRRLNLTQPEYPLRKDIDAIFFRNVGIYFDPDTQRQVLIRILSHLRVSGFLFLGPCECPSRSASLRPLGENVYQKVTSERGEEQDSERRERGGRENAG